MPRECKTGFINQYIAYTRPQQSPTLFHTWTAISTIASTLRRRVWIEWDYLQIYPNLYTILVSASGIGNKSTAIKIGTERILRKAMPDLAIMRGKLSMPYLIEWMNVAQSKNPDKLAEVTIHCSEFKVFARGAYSDSGLIEDLTDLYDCGPFEYRLKNSPISIVEKPCINIIAASTPEWLTTGSAADFIGGGFSSRIVPVALLKDEKSISRPKMTQIERDLEAALIIDLNTISKLTGPFLMIQDADKYFDDWYKVRTKYQNPDQRMAGYYAKKHTLVLKVAMILSVSINDDLVITEDHIESALQLLGKLELNIPFAFQGVAWGEQAKFQDKVMMKIQTEKEIGHAELLQHFHYCMTGNDLKQIIQTLLDEDRIEFERRTTTGRQKLVYRWKEVKP